MTMGNLNGGLSKILHNGFWKPNIGHVVIVVTILIGYGRMSERFDNVIRKQGEDETRIETMDKAGTNFSSNKLVLEQGTLTDHSDRLRKLEDVVSDIKVMKRNIDIITEDVHDLKTRKP